MVLDLLFLCLVNVLGVFVQVRSTGIMSDAVVDPALVTELLGEGLQLI